MADGSWDTYTPERPSTLGRFGGRLLVGLGVAAAAIALLVVALVSVARSRRSHAWDLARRVEAQLRSDDTARELYRRNPVLARSYPDEEGFLARAREHRDGLGLPDAEPPEGPEYQVGTGPFQLWVQFKCTGGTWIRALHGYGEPFGSSETGDGLVRLVLGRDQADLRQQARRLGEQRAAAPWRRFLALGRELQQEDGWRALAARHPGLRTIPGDPQTFAETLQRRRGSLAALPAERRKDGSIRIHSRTGPFMNRLDVEADLADGGLLRARWERDALVELELR